MTTTFESDDEKQDDAAEDRHGVHLAKNRESG